MANNHDIELLTYYTNPQNPNYLYILVVQKPIINTGIVTVLT